MLSNTPPISHTRESFIDRNVSVPCLNFFTMKYSILEKIKSKLFINVISGIVISSIILYRVMFIYFFTLLCQYLYPADKTKHIKH